MMHARLIGAMMHARLIGVRITVHRVSSFGAVATVINDSAHVNVTLRSSEATVDTAGVIGFKLVEEDGRVLILTSTIKLTMHMFENLCMGNSIMSLDHTFKIMKEQMEMVTLGTVDNGRHGKTLAFGPSSHTDTAAVSDACELFASFFRVLISGIRNRALPDVWSETVKQATYLKYGAIVDANPQVVECRPQRGLSDLAPAILNGMLETLKTEKHIDCYAHTWRAISAHLKPQLDEKTMTDLIEVLAFFNAVPPMFCDLLFYCDPALGGEGDDLLFYCDKASRARCAKNGALYELFEREWRKRIGDEAVDYLMKYHMLNMWSHAWNEPGMPTTTNAHERLHSTIKSEQFYNTVEGVATVVAQSVVVGCRLSNWSDPFVTVPQAEAQTWKDAQKLVKNGYFNLKFKMTIGGKDSFVFPSCRLLEPKSKGGHMPDDADTTAKKIAALNTWGKEYMQLIKKKNKYEKLHDGSWDLDVLLDMMFSFWVLHPIEATDPRSRMLLEAGIACVTCGH